MKRPIVLLLSLLLTAAAFAQPRPPRGGPEGRGPGGPPPGGAERLAQYLQLSDSQRTAWESEHTAFRASTQSLIAKQRDLEKQMHTSLDSASTDACALGGLMLQIRSIHEQMQSAHEALDGRLESLLTAEQKARFESFRASQPFMRPGPPPQN